MSLHLAQWRPGFAVIALLATLSASVRPTPAKTVKPHPVKAKPNQANPPGKQREAFSATAIYNSTKFYEDEAMLGSAQVGEGAPWNYGYYRYFDSDHPVAANQTSLDPMGYRLFDKYNSPDPITGFGGLYLSSQYPTDEPTAPSLQYNSNSARLSIDSQRTMQPHSLAIGPSPNGLPAVVRFYPQPYMNSDPVTNFANFAIVATFASTMNAATKPYYAHLWIVRGPTKGGAHVTPFPSQPYDKNVRLLYDTQLAPQSPHVFATTLTLQQGQVVDFVIGPEKREDGTYDFVGAHTTFNITITRSYPAF
ncbi:MAG: hypothetical protein JOZ57_14565 [Abitibacteriaceae bacterium]|nr:hypothetical protein [Abditibacteriaceae bacterium]